jgi:hypothetical protein
MPGSVPVTLNVVGRASVLADDGERAAQRPRVNDRQSRR